MGAVCKLVTVRGRSVGSFGGAALMLLACLTGCGQDPARGLDLHEVTGEVYYDGKPVEGARVAFRGGKSPRSAVATTDAEGKFTLATFEDATGAMPGSYQVTIMKVDPEVVANMSEARQLQLAAGRDLEENALPGRYASFQTTDLTAEITAGGDNHFVFELKSK